MKTLSLHGFAALIAVSVVGVFNSIAQEPTSASPAEQSTAQTIDTASPGVAPTPAAAPASTTTSGRKLPFGVDDILKLSKAQINEEVILTYITHSGVIYKLTANDVIYLRDQGVSDRVVNNLLEQQTTESQPAAQSSATTVQTQTTYPVAETVASYHPALAMEPISPLVVRPSALDHPVSTLLVIPYPPRTAAYYGYPQYYSSYYDSYGFPNGYDNCGFGGYFNDCAPSTYIRIGVRGGRYCSR